MKSLLGDWTGMIMIVMMLIVMIMMLTYCSVHDGDAREDPVAVITE
jgi:hypothetical protein